MKPRILMVDDEPDFQTIVRAWLGPEYECCPLKDGEELLGALRAGIPDLIILDLHLPGADGFELCRRLRAMPGFEAVPVLFLTASHEVQDYCKNFRAGGTSFLTKPIGRRRLLSAIGELIGDGRRARLPADVGGSD